MKTTTENTEEVLVIHAEGKLDAITAGEFEKEIIPIIQQSRQPVLIDFEKLAYIRSAGLRTVLILAKETSKNNNKLAFCCLNETVMEAFRISGFDTIVSICPTIEEGINFLK
jgi:anti-sigma B factor antagonist